MTDFEAFKSSQMHLVVFRDGLLAVSKVGYDEALAKNVSNVAAHGLTAALGPVGLLLTLATHAEELQREPVKAPTMETVPLQSLFSESQPTALVHGQFARELRAHSRWPAVEWFRPVLAFPRGCLVNIEVRWSSTVRWRTTGGTWRSDVNFWRVSRLRRRLMEWGYHVQ